MASFYWATSYNGWKHLTTWHATFAVNLMRVTHYINQFIHVICLCTCGITRLVNIIPSLLYYMTCGSVWLIHVIQYCHVDDTWHKNLIWWHIWRNVVRPHHQHVGTQTTHGKMWFVHIIWHLIGGVHEDEWACAVSLSQRSTIDQDTNQHL